MLPCHSLSPRVWSNSCSLSQWCHPTVLSLLFLSSIFPSIRVFPIVKGVPMGKSSILELQARSHNRSFLSPTLMLSTRSFTSHPGFSHRLSLNLSVWNGIIHVCICVHACSGMSALCDPMDYSPPGSTVHGILQARILEWFAISYSRESSWPRDQTLVSRIAGSFFTVGATRD